MNADFSHFRFYVYTRIKLGITSKEVFEELKSAWGDQAPSYPTIRKWKTEFSCGSITFFDDAARSGQPSTSRNESTINQVREAIEQDSRMSTRDLSELLNVDNATIHRILTEELSLHYVCSVWIPHQLTAKNMELRVGSAKAIRKCLHSLKAAKFDRYVVTDETWVTFDPQHTKTESKVWIARDEPRPQVVRSSLSNRKTMLLVAFTANKRFSVCATAPNETVDSQLFIDFMRKTGDKWRTLRSNPFTLKELHLQMDNARPHSSAATTQFLEERGVSIVWQSPYSPDFNLCDRFLFNTLKAGLRKQTFQSHLEVEEAALRFLRQLPEEHLHAEIEKLYDHCQAVIDAGGAYVTD